MIGAKGAFFFGLSDNISKATTGKHIWQNSTNDEPSMGLFDSHSYSSRTTGEEYVESSGFHLLEIHLPSVGMSWLFFTVILLVAGSLWLLSRRFCRRRRTTSIYARGGPLQASTANVISVPDIGLLRLASPKDLERRRPSSSTDVGIDVCGGAKASEDCECKLQKPVKPVEYLP